MKTKTLTLRWDDDCHPADCGWVASVGDSRGWQPLDADKDYPLCRNANRQALLEAAEELAAWEGWWTGLNVIVDGHATIEDGCLIGKI